MSKKQPEHIPLYNKSTAYTAGWVASSSKTKKADCPFSSGTPLHKAWIKGFDDKKNEKKFNMKYVFDWDEKE